AKLAGCALFLHDGDDCAHHRRIVDHRPGDVSVLARPDLTHARLATHQKVTMAAADPAGPFVHDGFAVIRQRRALERGKIRLLAPARAPAAVETEQGDGRSLDAG